MLFFSQIQTTKNFFKNISSKQNIGKITSLFQVNSIWQMNVNVKEDLWYTKSIHNPLCKRKQDSQ